VSKGAAIVVGSAPCLHDDLKRALELYTFAFIVTVNGACVEIKDADAIVCGHTSKSEAFVKARLAAFPDGKPFEVFANWTREGGRPVLEHRSVTKWFGAEVSTGATSAAKAVRMMLVLADQSVTIADASAIRIKIFIGRF